MRAALLIALAACSFPEKHPSVADAAPDAEAPFGCVGLPFNTTAPAKIDISGNAADFGIGGPATGVTVTGMTNAGATVFSQTTDANGAFSAVVDTGGMAIDGFVVTTAGTYVPSYFYPPHPFDASAMTPLATLTMTELGQVGNPAGTAFAQLIAGDCVTTPLAGCTLAITPTPPTLIEYTIAHKLDMTATATDDSGYILVEGLPPGTSTFAATCPTGALRLATVTVAADSMYFIELEP